MSLLVRLFGGALGALVAVSLAGGVGVPPLDLSTIAGALLIGAWIMAWFVIGFAILPYVTFGRMVFAQPRA